VEGKKLSTFGDLEKAISERGGQKTKLSVDRDGRIQEVVLEPILIEGAGRIGVTPPDPKDFVKESLPLARIPLAAVQTTWLMASDMIRGLKLLITGELPLKQSLSGPLTIGRMMKQEAQAGWQEFLQLMAALNIMLGVINLLPIPVVDGGEITFCLIEGALGRRLKVKTYMFFKQAGFALLLALMGFVMWNDVAKLLKEWLKPQIL
jgi:regulator of sigma E protease